MTNTKLLSLTISLSLPLSLSPTLIPPLIHSVSVTLLLSCLFPLLSFLYELLSTDSFSSSNPPLICLLLLLLLLLLFLTALQQRKLSSSIRRSSIRVAQHIVLHKSEDIWFFSSWLVSYCLIFFIFLFKIIFILAHFWTIFDCYFFLPRNATPWGYTAVQVLELEHIVLRMCILFSFRHLVGNK